MITKKPNNNFSENYTFNIDGTIFDTKKGILKEHFKTKRGRINYKLKDNDGIWRVVSKSLVDSYCGVLLKIPETAKKLRMCGDGNEYYITVDGKILSFSVKNPQGLELKQQINTKGYPMVNLVYRGKKSNREVHSLMCEAFFMDRYQDNGLVCMHKDDIKTNIHLSNLSLGTYSDNNRDAYLTGVNKGNGLNKQIKQC